jgi:hypothetical protein
MAFPFLVDAIRRWVRSEYGSTAGSIGFWVLMLVAAAAVWFGGRALNVYDNHHRAFEIPIQWWAFLHPFCLLQIMLIVLSTIQKGELCCSLV